MKGADSSSSYNNINDPYNKDFVKGEENQSRAAHSMQPSAPMACGRRDVELATLTDDIFPGKLLNSSGGANTVGEANGLSQIQPQIIYRSGAEMERDYFRKLINVEVFRSLLKVQVIGSVVIFIAQVILYATSDEYWKVLLASGMGLWAPILFFAPACWLTYLTIKSPSGCVVGSATACHVLSVVVGLVLIILSMIHMAYLGQYTSQNYGSDSKYDPEVTARVIVSLMLIGAADVTVASLIASIQYFRITCCGRATINEL